LKLREFERQRTDGGASVESPAMRQYEDFMRHVFEHGTDKRDRTGTGTRSVFGYQMRFALREGFPLVTTKKLHLRSIIHELLWFLRGESTSATAREPGHHLDEWADEHGELGPVYGVQWRSCRRPAAATSTRSPPCCARSAPTPTRGG